MFILDPTTGKIILRKKLGCSVDVNSTPLVTESEIIFGTANNGIIALDRQTLDEKWHFKTGPSLILFISLFHTTVFRSGNNTCIDG